MPDEMMAIRAERPGGPEVLVPVRVPTPRPGPGDILIRVAAAGVNRPDLMQRQGFYPPPPGVTDVPGLEVAGEVVARGDGVPDAAIGAKVAALVSGGGYAEFCQADWRHCLPVPDSLSLGDAAALPETLFTVWHNLVERGRPEPGDFVLVHGGTSGIGTMAIALGQLLGLRVIVTCGSADKAARALALGAAHAVNYREQDFVEAVSDITDAKGVAIVLDMVGGDYLPRNLKCLADEGRHVSIAVQRGPKAELDIWGMMRRRLTLTGSTLRPRSAEWKADLAARVREQPWPWVENGRLRPVIDCRFPLARAADAHARMEAGAHVGKIVLQARGLR